MLPHALASPPSLTHLGGVDAEECAELLKGDVDVQLGRGKHVVLDYRPLEHLRRTRSQAGRASRLGTRGVLQAGFAGWARGVAGRSERTVEPSLSVAIWCGASEAAKAATSSLRSK